MSSAILTQMITFWWWFKAENKSGRIHSFFYSFIYPFILSIYSIIYHFIDLFILSFIHPIIFSHEFIPSSFHGGEKMGGGVNNILIFYLGICISNVQIVKILFFLDFSDTTYPLCTPTHLGHMGKPYKVKLTVILQI